MRTVHRFCLCQFSDFDPVRREFELAERAPKFLTVDVRDGRICGVRSEVRGRMSGECGVLCGGEVCVWEIAG